MPNPNVPQSQNYDPRWFIWTIVFLVAAGVGLTTYIMLSDPGTNDYAEISAARAAASRK